MVAVSNLDYADSNVVVELSLSGKIYGTQGTGKADHQCEFYGVVPKNSDLDTYKVIIKKNKTLN